MALPRTGQAATAFDGRAMAPSTLRLKIAQICAGVIAGRSLPAPLTVQTKAIPVAGSKLGLTVAAPDITPASARPPTRYRLVIAGRYQADPAAT
jgi:hypothetical protein